MVWCKMSGGVKCGGGVVECGDSEVVVECWQCGECVTVW